MTGLYFKIKRIYQDWGGGILSSYSGHDEIKKKLRRLKKLEIKIRFGGSFHAVNSNSSYSSGSYSGKPSSYQTKPGNPALVWDTFFHMDGRACGKAGYTAEDVASMSKETYRNVIDEFFFSVYYKYYMECGITGSHLYDPELLGWMGLSADAGSEEIKKKFRELAIKYHPDTGGDENKFIKLMENYQKLIK